MTRAEWQRIKTIVQAALEIEPDKRARFVAENCSGDEFLLGEVKSLLDSYGKAGDFIQTPAFVGKIEILASNNFPAELAAGKRLGRYEIRSLIGEGGMGAVYLAEDTRLRRKVAIKVLPADLINNRERLRRFEQEAQAASALNHPNIITIYEIGESENASFIAAEYIEGETLRNRLNGEQMTIKSVLEVAVQIASALQAAHGAGIIHRDIKPENVMIRPDGLVKILDFGIAKLTESYLPRADSEATTAAVRIKTTPGMIIGTANYMSPEQARGKAVDARTDVWSFGVVLYEMIGGTLSFKGETATDLIIAIVEKEPPPLVNFAFEQIPAELDQIVTKTLRKNPDERYQTSGELLADLNRLRQKLEIESLLGSSDSTRENGYAATTAGGRRLALKPLKTRLPSIFTARSVTAFAAVIVLILSSLAYLRWSKAPSVTNQPQVKSLAVLPLKSLDKGENYLGLGIADAIIRRISQTGKLIVRPTSSVRTYLDQEADAMTAAGQLNVDAVLDGTVQQSENRLRVSVNLLRTSDGASLWADSFDMRVADIFTIQDTVAQQVASSLQLRLDSNQQARLTKRNTSNPIAYEYFIKGVNGLDQRRFGAEARANLETTISYFKRATEADPNYALAHAQLAFSYAWMAIFIEPKQDWIELAKAELARAEALDTQLAEIHLTRYLILFSAYEGFQIEAAIRELLLAQQINPNIGHDELGNLYYHIGLEDLGDRQLRRALEIDPTSEYVKNTISGSYRIVKKFDQWNAANQKYFGGRTKPHSWFYISQGRLDEAERLLEQEFEKNPEEQMLHSRKMLLLALKGDFRQGEDEARFLTSHYPVKNLAYHHATYDIACFYALAGNSAEAVKWLRETVATGFPNYPLFNRDPFLDRIRQTPEFVQFMAEIKTEFERYKREFE
jgi:serine/threonine-protein kinase